MQPMKGTTVGCPICGGWDHPGQPCRIPAGDFQPIPRTPADKPILGDYFIHERTGMRFRLTGITMKMPGDKLLSGVDVILAIEQ
jgi:hypothetical protein